MSILFDEAQASIATESRRVLASRSSVERQLALLDQPGTYDADYWRTASEMGWPAIPIAEEYGGIGLGLTEMGLVAEASGRSLAGAPFLTAGLACARALQCSGSAELRNEWLPGLASGEIKACIALADASDPLPAKPSTRFVDATLTGVQKGVTGGLAANVALVWAQRPEGPALVLVPLTAVSRSAIDSFDASRLVCDLRFDQTPSFLVAEGGQGRDLALDLLAAMSVVTAHEQVGAAEHLLEIARDYSLTRRAFGQPIGAFQSVKHRIAELYALVQLARANCIHAAASDGQPGFIAAAGCARLSATEAYDTAARDCIQIHGGIGVTWEQGLHLHMRRARSLAIEHGNMFFWEDLVAWQITGVEA